MNSAGGNSFCGLRISAMTLMKDWFPANAKAMLSSELTVSTKVGLPKRTILTSKPGGALGPATPSDIMTMRTEATIEMVQIQLMAAAKVSLRGRQSSQQRTCGMAINATVQIAWDESVLSATDMVMFAEAQIRTRLKMKATPKKRSKFFPPM